MKNFLKKLVGGVVKVAAPVVIATALPETLINVAAGGVLKHKTRMDNGKIPYWNLAISTAVSYGKRVLTGEDPVASIIPAAQEGGLWMAGSTAIHQALKLPKLFNINGKSI